LILIKPTPAIATRIDPFPDLRSPAMRVSDICSRSVSLIGLSSSAREAAWKMNESQTGTLVVVARNDATPIGILTDRDLVLRVLAKGASPEAVPVGDVMTRDVGTCRSDDDLFKATQTMRRYGVRRLPVLDESGHVIGLITADDIYAVLAAHMKELGQASVREKLHEVEALAH
jgi:signal-transduction protein with cAMP-binding, CBS, and nucleotidyltransferase domain